MENIKYKTTGAVLERGPSGKLIRKPVQVTVEEPYSENNMKKAEAAALPGSLQVIPQEAPAEPPLERILLKDRAVGMIYEVYIENGKLMMEVL